MDWIVQCEEQRSIARLLSRLFGRCRQTTLLRLTVQALQTLLSMSQTFRLALVTYDLGCKDTS